MTAASFVCYPTAGYTRSNNARAKDETDTTIESCRPAMQVESSQGRIQVKVAGHVPAWLPITNKEMNELLNLETDWDSYGAKPVSPDAAVAAIWFLGLVMQKESMMPFIVPMSSGNIQLEWHASGVDIEVEITPHGPNVLSIEEANGVSTTSSVHGNLGVMKQVISKIPRR